MIEKQIVSIVNTHMKNGYNCCQSVLLTASEAFNIALSQDTLQAASLFTRGMESGCACGALVGMAMFSGIIAERYHIPEKEKLPQKLHDEFQRKFGSTCCRALRKKHGFMQNIGNRACRELTVAATVMLIAVLEDKTNESGNLGDYPNTQ